MLFIIGIAFLVFAVWAAGHGAAVKHAVREQCESEFCSGWEAALQAGAWQKPPEPEPVRDRPEPRPSGFRRITLED